MHCKFPSLALAVSDEVSCSCPVPVHELLAEKKISLKEQKRILLVLLFSHGAEKALKSQASPPL